MRYQFNQEIENAFKDMGFFSFARKIGNKYGKKVIDTAIKTVENGAIDTAKTTPKRFHKNS